MVRKIALSFLVVAAVAGADSSLAVARPSTHVWIRRPPVLVTSGRLPTLPRAMAGVASASTITVRLRGQAVSTLQLELDAVGSSSVRGAFALEVSKHGVIVYSGPVPSGRMLALGVIAPGEARSYRFRLTFSPAVGNGLQAQQLAYSARWLVTD